MNHSTSYKKFFLKWPWLLLIWTTIALISATLLYIKVVVNGGAPYTWWSLFIIKLVTWLFWGAMMPVVFYLGKKFRIDKKNWYLGLLFHVPISLVLGIFNLFLYTLTFLIISGSSLTYTAIVNTTTMLFIELFEWHFIIYWAVIIVGYALDYYNKYKDKELTSIQLESKLVLAQLQALKMQLHPHFLFNTLNTIASLVRFDEKKEAVSMLSGLSDLLRIALLQRGQHEVPLKLEIEFLEKYLEIEKVRFKDRLELRFDISDDVAKARVPNFLLQPIVENAIYHGLAKKLSAKLLEIRIKKEDNNLSISIFNEGPHLPNNFDVRKCNGIGLSNTIERLSQLFGDNYQMNFANLRDGVNVNIRIPFLVN